MGRPNREPVFANLKKNFDTIGYDRHGEARSEQVEGPQKVSDGQWFASALIEAMSRRGLVFLVQGAVPLHRCIQPLDRMARLEQSTSPATVIKAIQGIKGKKYSHIFCALSLHLLGARILKPYISLTVTQCQNLSVNNPRPDITRLLTAPSTAFGDRIYRPGR